MLMHLLGEEQFGARRGGQWDFGRDESVPCLTASSHTTNGWAQEAQSQ